MSKEAIMVKSALEHRMVAEKGFQARTQQVYKFWARLASAVPAVHLYFVLSRPESTSFLGGDDVVGNNHYVMLSYYVYIVVGNNELRQSVS